MFRDDLKAALARSEQLQRELAEVEARAESSEGELSELRERLAEQERELKKLRKGSTREVKAPKQQSQSLLKLLVVAGLFGLMATAGAVVLLLRRPEAPRAGAPKVVVAPPTVARKVVHETVVAGPTITLDPSAAAFRDLVQTVPDKCRLGISGWPTKCEPKDLLDTLRRQQEAVGSRAATLTYCSLLWSPREPVRRFAAYRLSNMVRLRNVGAGEGAFRCLDHFVRHAKSERRTARAARAWAAVGGSLGHGKAIVETLEGLDHDRRLAALRGLWMGGRLTMLPYIAKVLAAGGRKEGEAVLEGFGYESWSEAERNAVCPLFAKTMEGARDRRLAARAAYSLAGRRCGSGVYSQRIYTASAKELTSNSRVDFWWAAALGLLCTKYRTSDPVCGKVADLFETVARNRQLVDSRRGQALNQLRRLDAARARKVAATLGPGAGHGYGLKRAIENALKVEK